MNYANVAVAVQSCGVRSGWEGDTLPLFLLYPYIYSVGKPTGAEFLEVIETTVFRVFLLAIHSHLY